MNKMLPKASKKSLEELLKFLGPRAEDFKKCFDTESEWCLKYADLMMRNVNDTRKHEYKEGHHVIPACYYGSRSRSIDKGNLISLPYGEHLYAHYCAVNCAIGRMKHKMSRAFCTMYSIGVGKKRPLFPTDEELIAAIPELEAKRILFMIPSVKRVEVEGRTHKWEDKAKAEADWRELNRETLRAKSKAYRENNSEAIKESQRKTYNKNKEYVCARQRAYNATKREEQKAYSKAYREAHPEYHKEYCKQYYIANKESLRAKKKEYYDANHESILLKGKKYRDEHRDEIRLKGQVRYKENHEAILAQKKEYHKKHRDELLVKMRKYQAEHRDELLAKKRIYQAEHKDELRISRKKRYDSMVNAGYRFRKDPVTGKRGWVFVGLPGKSEAA